MLLNSCMCHFNVTAYPFLTFLLVKSGAHDEPDKPSLKAMCSSSNNTKATNPQIQSTSNKDCCHHDCHGFHLDFGEGHIPAFSYPFQIHGT
jgi:hypothetical protein